ncbi:MAG: hypothetical protein Q9209_001294 [Squamulea sp. 1 TL-2023]
MPTDGDQIKFLYTILKQCDPKSVDWDDVAEKLEMTNAHAAQMRYYRLKKVMEGNAPKTQGSKEATSQKRKQGSGEGAKSSKKQKKDLVASSNSSPELMESTKQTELSSKKAKPIAKEEEVGFESFTIKTEPNFEEV